MQIDWNEKLGGYTMIQAREALRRLYRATGEADFCEIAGPGGDPNALRAEMLARGWIETTDSGGLDLTVRGNAVAMAKKLKPITRADAEALLEQVLEAAHEINSDERYAKGVSRLAVFGSFLSDSATLNDLDIAYALKARWEQGDGAGMKEASARSNEAWPPPSSADYMQKLFWPETVVKRRLKVSRRVSLVEFSDIEALGCAFRTLIPAH